MPLETGEGLKQVSNCLSERGQMLGVAGCVGEHHTQGSLCVKEVMGCCGHRPHYQGELFICSLLPIPTPTQPPRAALSIRAGQKDETLTGVPASHLLVGSGGRFLP